MFDFSCLIMGMKLKLWQLFFLLLCILSFYRAQASPPYFQNASSANRSGQYTKGNILILSAKSVVQSSQDKSLNSGDQALKLAVSANWENGKSKAYSLSGNTYWYMIDYEGTYEYFAKAYEIATQIKVVPGSINNTIDIGIGFDAWSELNEALMYYKKGPVLAELNKDAEPIYTELGMIAGASAASNQYPEVFAAIKRMAKVSNSMGDERLIVEQYLNLGDLYWDDKSAGPHPYERIPYVSRAAPVQAKTDVSLIPVLNLRLQKYVKKTTVFWGIFN